MSERLFLPLRFGRGEESLQQKPQKFVGYTGDGKVGFTPAGAALFAGLLSPDDAGTLTSELLSATYEAQKVADEAKGLNEWVSTPCEGGFEVRFRGQVGRFRPIKNGKRKVGAHLRAIPIFGSAPPPLVRAGHRCTVCKAESPEGATMYVHDRKNSKDHRANEEFSGHRACEACMRPELRAAKLSASEGGKS